jgi:hypothetical protein
MSLTDLSSESFMERQNTFWYLYNIQGMLEKILLFLSFKILKLVKYNMMGHCGLRNITVYPEQLM